MATKMLFELQLPPFLAKAKEDMGMNNIFKYMRYYRMYTSRFAWKVGDKDYSYVIENTRFWRGMVCFVKDAITNELVVLTVDDKSIKYDYNGKIEKLSASNDNSYVRKNLTVGKDCVLLYSDSTHLPPVLYIWSVGNSILEVEDIIKQQNNMLRKPIIIYGQGEEFDNALNKAMNVLSGIEFINLKPKSGKGSIMEDMGTGVLDLQVNNAYKGKELWESRGKYEELIKDYLGYSSVNNQKKERMIQAEVSESKSVCDTFYKDAVRLSEQAVEDIKKVLGIEVEFIKNLEQEEVKEDDKENDVQRVSDNSGQQ